MSNIHKKPTISFRPTPYERKEIEARILFLLKLLVCFSHEDIPHLIFSFDILNMCPVFYQPKVL